MACLLRGLSRPVCRGLDALFDGIRGLLALVSRLIASTRSSNLQLVENPLRSGGESRIDGLARGAGAVAEVVGVAFSHGPEFIGGAALVVGDTIGVEIRLQLRVGPGVEGGVFGGIGGRGKIGSNGSIATTAGFGGTGIAVLGLLKEVVTGGTGFVSSLIVLCPEPFPANTP